MNFLTLLCNNAVTAANPAPVVTQMKSVYDVIIAGIICVSFAVVAIVALCKFFGCRKKKKETTNSSDQAPKNLVEDRIYNEKMMYVAKLLDLLKDQTKADVKLKKEECKHYEETLLKLIEKCETKTGH